MILAIGYRVRSNVGMQFRNWTSKILKEYMQKGFVMNDERLKNPKKFGEDYFDELLERIRDICKGKKPGRRCRTKKIEWAKEIEIYSSGRYFTVTGNTILETGINERSSELKEVYERYFTEDKKTTPIAPSCSREKNKETLSIGLEKDKKLNDFINGIFDTKDESAKDMALMGKLLYWTNNDVELAISEFLKTPFVEGMTVSRLAKELKDSLFIYRHGSRLRL